MLPMFSLEAYAWSIRQGNEGPRTPILHSLTLNHKVLVVRLKSP